MKIEVVEAYRKVRDWIILCLFVIIALFVFLSFRLISSGGVK